MPIEQSIDKIVSTISLNVKRSYIEPALNYFPDAAQLHTVSNITNYPYVSTFSEEIFSSSNSFYVDYANLYFDIPYELYAGFPNLLNRISLRILPVMISVQPAYSYISASTDIFTLQNIESYAYIAGYSYIYFFQTKNIHYLKYEDDLILAWKTSNNKVFEYIPDEVPPELPPSSGDGGSRLKEFWA